MFAAVVCQSNGGGFNDDWSALDAASPLHCHSARSCTRVRHVVRRASRLSVTSFAVAPLSPPSAPLMTTPLTPPAIWPSRLGGRVGEMVGSSGIVAATQSWSSRIPRCHPGRREATLRGKRQRRRRPRVTHSASLHSDRRRPLRLLLPLGLARKVVGERFVLGHRLLDARVGLNHHNGNHNNNSHNSSHTTTTATPTKYTSGVIQS